MHLDHRINHTFRPQLLALEGRAIPSASATIVGAKLSIQADTTASQIIVGDDGHGNVTASVKSAAGTVAIKGSNIAQIVIQGGDGNDTVDFQLKGSMMTALDLEMDLGAGNDRAHMDFYRGIAGAPLTVDVHGGAGNDSVDAIFGTINNANVAYRAALGEGADASNVTLFKGVSGASNASFDVAGENGADRVDFNVMGKIDATAGVDLRAENALDANDRVAMRYRGELDGMLCACVDKAASWYGVQSQFTLDAASTGMLTAVVRNSIGSYGSTFQVTDHASGPKATTIDRLEPYLSEPAGTVTHRFDPATLS